MILLSGLGGANVTFAETTAIYNASDLFTSRDSFHSILLLEGILELEYSSGKEILEKGDSLFVPAGYGPYWLRGHGRFLLTMV